MPTSFVFCVVLGFGCQVDLVLDNGMPSFFLLWRLEHSASFILDHLNFELITRWDVVVLSCPCGLLLSTFLL